MKLIVGLGNPGKEYKNTRHNVGFILLDAFVSEKDLSWKFNAKAQAETVKYEDTLLAKPQTFMNKSGISVSYLANYYKVSLDDILIVHDDVDLDYLQTKLQYAVGPAGHKGVEDIIVSLKSKDFWRFRVGIGRPENVPMDTQDWVLSRFSSQELEELKNISLPISGY